ncbi:hypothetical protein QSH18_08955 [Xanthomonas sp. NCPPB 2654]|uniref:hypothetical protein n=1 Tax=unclassified Xanthomonas TaxID=2643310 RepID=UPI0021DFFD0F|nr:MULTISPECIES: hypothetical protein [unclassified Xanthomonas]MDL5365732.1 hypothetical protein [Xanthomonas sp. NCPPB 2654]UYC19881.1 hypothetical protein NUG20_17165 [Xanthomonas sp. CFBP 8443]
MNSLRNFYFLRAGVAFAWVAAVLLSAPASVALAGTLLAFYPAWDALANVLDARRSGGLQANPGQAFNALVSAVTAVAMAIAFAMHGNAGGVLVFGAWALLAGLFQLAVGIRRRKLGGQVFMMISGTQSALAGVFFVIQSFGAAPTLAQLAPYAGFGGVYFLLSALWLSFRKPRPVSSGS